MNPTPSHVWKFEPRAAVNPLVSKSEWTWIVDWARQNELSGKVYAVRTLTLEGEYATVQFDIFEGQTTARDRDTRNL